MDEVDSELPLHAAVRRGDMGELRRLLDRGFGVDERDHGTEQNALELALELERLDIAEMLLDAGADPNSFSGASDNCPLASAASLRPEARALTAVDLLARRGAKRRGYAVTAAAMAGNAQVLDRLHDLPTAVDDDDEEPAEEDRQWEARQINGLLLAAAVRDGDDAAFDAFLAREPHVADAPAAFAAAFDAAARHGKLAMFRRLRAMQTPDVSRTLRAAFGGYWSSSASDGGATLSEIAAMASPADLAELLMLALNASGQTKEAEHAAQIAVERGADLDHRDHAGRTVVHVVAERHEIERLEWLVSSGADLHAEDKAGNGVWAYAGLWPQSIRYGEFRAHLAKLGVPRHAWTGPKADATARDDGLGCELWAIGIGVVIALVIVAVVLLLHAIGLL